MTLKKQKEPVFERHIPVPVKCKSRLVDHRRSYAIGQEQFALSYLLSCMQVGESCLLSNWAQTSVNYIQNKHGFRFQREAQDDGTVRIWRVE